MESVQEPVPWPSTLNCVPPFLNKTYDMVDDPKTNEVVSWSSGNNSFVVLNVPVFSMVLLPKYFKHNNLSSFVRQLNTYGFRKVDPDRWEFANEGFLRGQKQLLKSIVRRKSSHVQHTQQQTQVQNSSVERLKWDKNVPMQELVRLRQQQEAADNQLQNMGQKFQVMEQSQQQMMSFLAKAVQIPGFLNQLVQKNNDGSRQIQGIKKKRRVAGDEHENCGIHGANNSQIVRNQPSINKAAENMLRQFLNASTSPQCESVLKYYDSSLLGDVRSSDSIDNGNPSNTVSGTLPDVSASTAHTQLPEVNLGHHPEDGLVQPNLGSSPTQEVPPGPSWSLESDLIGCKTGPGECFDPIITASDVFEGDEISPEGEGKLNELLDEVQDPFWEQLFGDESQEIRDTDEILSGKMENNDLVIKQEPPNTNQQAMNYLSEQVGLLS